MTWVKKRAHVWACRPFWHLTTFLEVEIGAVSQKTRDDVFVHNILKFEVVPMKSKNVSHDFHFETLNTSFMSLECKYAYDLDELHILFWCVIQNVDIKILNSSMFFRAHFADICTSVISEVTEKKWNTPEGDVNVTTPMVVNTLRNFLYLPPMRG